jgi:DNA repair protein RecN (Recombination protein N)
MEREIEESRKNEDYLRFLYNELEQAGLEAGQQEQLEQESETLSHIEDIKNALFVTDGILSGAHNYCQPKYRGGFSNGEAKIRTYEAAREHRNNWTC